MLELVGFFLLNYKQRHNHEVYLFLEFIDYSGMGSQNFSTYMGAIIRNSPETDIIKQLSPSGHNYSFNIEYTCYPHCLYKCQVISYVHEFLNC